VPGHPRPGRGHVRRAGHPLRRLVDRCRRWSGGPIPPTPLTLTPPLTAGQQTSVAGQAFTIDLSALQPCGYVVRLGISDRAVVNSAWTGRTVYIERGICLD